MAKISFRHRISLTRELTAPALIRRIPTPDGPPPSADPTGARRFGLSVSCSEEEPHAERLPCPSTYAPRSAPPLVRAGSAPKRAPGETRRRAGVLRRNIRDYAVSPRGLALEGKRGFEPHAEPCVVTLARPPGETTRSPPEPPSSHDRTVFTHEAQPTGE